MQGVARWSAAPFPLLHGPCDVIESTLFFTLGFLCAGFLALMIAPAIWRRAVNLTRRRIEASVPLTLNEIQADKDRLRAEFAMSTRRLEMSIKGFKEKAAEQIAEIGRSREELKRLAVERDEKHAANTALEAQGAELRAELRQREDQLQQANARLGEAGKALDARALDLERLGGLYEEATFAASGRQIELVARESEIEKLSDDLARASKGQREFDRRLGDADTGRRNALDTRPTASASSRSRGSAPTPGAASRATPRARARWRGQGQGQGQGQGAGAVEYVVAANNGTKAATASFPTWTKGKGAVFTPVFGTDTAVKPAADGTVKVTVPPLLASACGGPTPRSAPPGRRRRSRSSSLSRG